MDKPDYTLEFVKPLRELEKRLDELKEISKEHKIDVSQEMASVEKKIETTRKKIFSNLSNWQQVQLARHPRRPYALDYIEALFTDFEELHGDRCFGDDQALIGGTAFFEKKPVMLLAQQKGRSTKENIRRNFGMAHPEGYRKALRLMKMAAKFKLPVVSFVDTPGAYPGLGGEQRHVAEAIAVNLREMSLLPVPIVALVIGEGGSGGALGISVADRILVMEHAYYSVISPEGCAAILWKNREMAPQAAEAMKISSKDLLDCGVADELIKEPFEGAHTDPALAGRNVRIALSKHLKALRGLSREKLLVRRYEKFRAIGEFEEETVAIIEEEPKAEEEPVASGSEEKA